MTSFNKEVADGWPEETKYSSEELARLVAKEGIKHLQLQLQGERAPGVISWVYDVDDWRGYALAIPELDIHSLQRHGADFNFYTVDREKKKVIEPVKRLQVKKPSGLATTQQQIENISQEFYKDELVLIWKMIGKAALFGPPDNKIDGPVHQSLAEEYLDSLAETFGDGLEPEPDFEPYEEKEFIYAAKERSRGIAGFEDDSVSMCVSYKFDDEEYFIQISTLCGELEAGSLIKLTGDKAAVHDTVEYSSSDEANSDYSGFWDLNRLVTTIREGKEIDTKAFMEILNKSEPLDDINNLP